MRVVVALACLALLAACSPGSTGTGPAQPGTSAASQSIEDVYVTVVKTVNPSVVMIETAGGLGSGVVFDGQGNIVTNAHVVGQEQTFRVSTSDGRQYPGRLVGSFPPDDIAVVRVDSRDLKPARFADSAKAQVGQPVLAIGSPLGLRSSVTQGIVSGTNRVVGEGGGVTLPDTIQTSAAINPGNSGGALADLEGAVLGIPTLAALLPGADGGSVAPGIGFAISSNRAVDIAGQLVKNGRVVNTHRAYLGVQTAPTTAGGVLVVGTVPGGPAQQAGIQTGDLIIAVDGTPTPMPGDLGKVLASHSPGDTLKVDLVHAGGRKETVSVKLGELPAS